MKEQGESTLKSKYTVHVESVFENTVFIIRNTKQNSQNFELQTAGDTLPIRGGFSCGVSAELDCQASEVGLSESVPVFLGKAWFYNCVQATKWGLFSFRITELSQLVMPLMRSVIE